MTSTRRGLLLLLASGAAACATPARVVEVRPLETRTVPTADGRSLSVRVRWPSEVKGVVLFSHGGGADPAVYEPLATAWAADGWLVLSPIHVESSAHPDRARYTVQSAFGPRIADMRAVSALAGALAPGRPLVAAGHSYGSVFAAMAGGALADRGGTRDEKVRAVIMLSSPGVIPALITDQAYATLRTPLLVLTGDADTVPGVAPDWRVHLRPFESSPAGDKTAIVRKGGDHSFGLREADSAQARDAAAATTLFLRAYGLGDARAARDWGAQRSTETLDVRRR